MSLIRHVPELAIRSRAPLPDGEDFDVLIAGAGMAGLYTAWRLQNDGLQSPQLKALAEARPDKKLKIGIVEYSDRVGGRLDSVILAGMENVPAELGGMRFTKSHQLLNLLVDRLGLRPYIDTFPMSGNSQFTLRDVRLDEAAIMAGEKVPYNLKPAELYKTPNQLFNYAIEQVVGEGALKYSDANWQWVKEHFRYTSKTTVEKKNFLNKKESCQEENEADEERVYNEAALYNIGFWDLLYSVLSNEGYDYCWDGGGYNSNTINWNAAEAMPYMLTDFSVTPQYLRFKNGFHTLPATLAKRIEGTENPVPIYPNTRLVRFQREDDGRVSGVVAMTSDESQRAAFTASYLVLAMPRHSLELMDQDTEFFNASSVQWNIQSVLLQPAYKLFMAYENRWWNKDMFYPGPTITDMPLRMTYDFGTEAEHGGTATDGRALLLASYCDMQGASFWSVLERSTTYTEPPSWDDTGAKGGAPGTESMCRMAEGMLKISLSVDGKEPKPSRRLASYYQDWSQAPYGAGFHAWAAHYKAWEVMRSVRQPLEKWPVFICGEAYSNQQGWVEGAVCTAESVLEDKFGLPRIYGLPDTYPLLTPVPVKPGTHEPNATYLLRETPNAF